MVPEDKRQASSEHHVVSCVAVGVLSSSEDDEHDTRTVSAPITLHGLRTRSSVRSSSTLAAVPGSQVWPAILLDLVLHDKSTNSWQSNHSSASDSCPRANVRAPAVTAGTQANTAWTHEENGAEL